MNKRETHIVQGMTRDLAVHRFNPNMVVDAKNIRITTSGTEELFCQLLMKRELQDLL